MHPVFVSEHHLITSRSTSAMRCGGHLFILSCHGVTMATAFYCFSHLEVVLEQDMFLNCVQVGWLYLCYCQNLLGLCK